MADSYVITVKERKMANPKPKIIYFRPGMAVRASQVYMDANFLVALSRPAHVWHGNATALLASLQERNIKLNLSSLAFNEAVYQALRLAQRDQTTQEDNNDSGVLFSPEENTTKNYSPALGWFDTVLLDLPNLQFFEPPNARLHHRTLHAITEFGLDPTDAFHYEAAHRLNCPLVTNDVQFQRIPDPNLTIITFFASA